MACGGEDLGHDEPVPMPSKGKRIALTVRLPFDEYREVSVRARGRGWSLSDYVGFCVAREIGGRGRGVNESVPVNAVMRQWAEDTGNEVDPDG
jgi:hypothetical protein